MSRLTALITLLLATTAAQATTIHVPADQPTIQAGINISVDGDTVLVAPGSYYSIDYLGKAITVISSGGPTETEIWATQPGATVKFETGEPKGSELRGFTIRSGYNSGISCIGSSPTIADNIIRANRSTEENRGAAINLVSTTGSVVTGNVMTGNTAALYGAAVHIGDGCQSDTISYNTLFGNEGFGEIRCLGTVTDILIHNNTIWTTTSAGIATNVTGDVVVKNNIVFGSPSYGMVGSMVAEYNCVFDNVDGPFSFEPGIGNIYTDALLRDIEYEDFSLRLSSDCIDTGDPHVAYNDSDGSRNDIGAVPFVHSYPIPAAIRLSPGVGERFVTTLDPLVAWSYLDEAASEQTAYQIQVGSDDEWTTAEYLDSGPITSSDTGVYLTSSLPHDYTEYWLRIRLQNNSSWGDWLSWRFSTHASPVIDVPGDFGTCQQALDIAWSGDTVQFAEGLYFGPGNSALRLHGKEVVVRSRDGLGACTIRCDDSVAFVLEESDTVGAVIRDLTFLGNGIDISGNGGAIRCLSGSARFVNCRFENNFVTNAGGAIYGEYAHDLVVDSCIFVGNQAIYGGAVYTTRSNNLTIISSSFDNNQAISMGGAVNFSRSEAGIDISFSKFTRNVCGWGSAVAIDRFSSAVLSNCTFADNVSPDSNGTVSFGGDCAVSIYNTIIAYSRYGRSVDGGPAMVSCSDFYGNDNGDWDGALAWHREQNNNFSEPPYFCDRNNGNLSILPESPCAPDGNLCNLLLGAMEVGCDATDVAEPFRPNSLPVDFGLAQNYPNPFNPSTIIAFALPQRSHVELVVYNTLGQQVVTLVGEDRPPGEYTVGWHGEDSRGRPVSTGVYFYRIKAGEFVETKKMLLLK